MNILLVDDSRAMRMLVKRVLRQAGFGDHAVTEASNGKEALEMIRAETPHLILCDWNMPEMSGLELLQELGKNGPKTKFGFVTSEGTPEIRQLAIDSGALFVITKPFEPETFGRALRGVI